MNESDKMFGDRLLDLERPDPIRRQRYERQVQAMLEKQLTGWLKIGYILGLAVPVTLLVVFGIAAILAPQGFPWWGRAMFTLGAVFALIFLVMGIRTLKKGTINLKTDELAGAGLGWGFVVIMCTLCMVFADHFPDPAKALTIMVIFEVMAGLQLLKAFIQRSEVRTQERLLEIEYRIADLAERLDRPGREEEQGTPV